MASVINPSSYLTCFHVPTVAGVINPSPCLACFHVPTWLLFRLDMTTLVMVNTRVLKYFSHQRHSELTFIINPCYWTSKVHIVSHDIFIGLKTICNIYGYVFDKRSSLFTVRWCLLWSISRSTFNYLKWRYLFRILLDFHGSTQKKNLRKKEKITI